MTLLRPQYFREHDQPLIEQVLLIYQKNVGKNLRELRSELKGFCVGTQNNRIKYVIKAIDELWPKNQIGRNELRKKRANIFLSRFLDSVSFLGDLPYSEETLKKLKAEHGVEKQNTFTTQNAMYRDIPSIVPISDLTDQLPIDQIITSANAYLLKSYLSSCRYGVVRIKGGIRRVMRQIKFMGLLGVVTHFSEAEDTAQIVISGPISIFQHTKIYQKSFFSLMSVLPWCHRFSLMILGRDLYKGSKIIIKSGDPIAVNKCINHFDSKIEERFYFEFGGLTEDWLIERESRVITLEKGGYFFPDFILRSKYNESSIFYCEIIGFWTEPYLREKITKLNQSGLKQVLLLISEIHREKWPDLLLSHNIIWYKKSIDAKQVADWLTENGNGEHHFFNVPQVTYKKQ